MFIFKILKFFWEYFQDLCFTIKYNTYSPFEDPQLRRYYRIIILIHTIEKGMALPAPRKLFGVEKIKQVMDLVRGYDASFSMFPINKVYGTLNEYLKFHSEEKDPVLDEIKLFIEELDQLPDISSVGGIKSQDELKILNQSEREEFLSLMTSRFSCRQYQMNTVPTDIVEAILKAAQSAPSQCNRQSVRVHCFQDQQQIEHLLIMQGGAAGFARSVPNLFIVTYEVTGWGGFGQRNQGFVDGGLLSQGLFLACHAHGVGSCGLNVAFDNRKEKGIKALAGIHPRERLVMMISFGYPVYENLKAARSPRIPVDQILTIH